MNKIINEITAKLHKEDKQMIIGISGPGASGKTTFAKKLTDSLDVGVNYLNTDPYIITDARKYTNIEYEFQNERHAYKMTACHPAAHNLLALKRDVEMIREAINFKTIGTDYSESTLISSENKVSIVEGMSVAFLDLGLFDCSIYLHIDEATELQRRLIRDVSERGRSVEHLEKSHAQRRIQYEVFMHPHSEKFDLVIDNSMNDF